MSLPHGWVTDTAQQANNVNLDDRIAQLEQRVWVVTGVPTFNPGGPALALRLDGAAGSTLYVYENGAWTAK